MRIDMPTCQYGEDNCRKRFDGNCLLKQDLLDERCPIRRTINGVLEIIDSVDTEYMIKRNIKPSAVLSWHEAIDEIRNRVRGLRGEEQ